jgi:hypothetical protein
MLRFPNIPTFSFHATGFASKLPTLVGAFETGDQVFLELAAKKNSTYPSCRW